MSPLVIAGIVFVVTVLATAYFVVQVRELAVRVGLLGRVGARHLAKAAVPRLGGVGIFLGFCLGVGLTFFLPVLRRPDETAKIALMLVGSLLIFAVMLADDLAELPALPRLLWQFAAAGFVVLPVLFDPIRPAAPWSLPNGANGIIIDTVPNPFATFGGGLPAWLTGGSIVLPLLVAIPFTLVWIVGMANAINWIDGVDGLSGGVVCIACLVLFIHTTRLEQFTISLLPLVLGAAVLAFLRFNWHPSSIIMGDGGAMFLGYALAVSAIIGGAKIATTLLVLIVPVLNMAWAILVRLKRRTNPMEADDSHLHNALLRRGLSQRQVTLLAYAVCVAFGVFALLADRLLKLALFAAVAAALFAGLLLLAHQPPPDRDTPHGVPAD